MSEAKKTKTHMIVIAHETLLQSVMSDCMSFATIMGVIGVGWALNSSAMQWVGAIMVFIAFCAKSSSVNKRLTIEEARTKLDKIEAERHPT